MQQRGAVLEHLVEAGVGDSLAAPKFQPPQPSARDGRAPQPQVREGRAAVDGHPLDADRGSGPGGDEGEQRGEPRVRRRRGVEGERPPELRLPRERAEPPRDGRAAAEGPGAQVGEYAEDDPVRETLEEGAGGRRRRRRSDKTRREVDLGHFARRRDGWRFWLHHILREDNQIFIFR